MGNNGLSFSLDELLIRIPTQRAYLLIHLIEGVTAKVAQSFLPGRTKKVKTLNFSTHSNRVRTLCLFAGFKK
jgi:hypothetical protein